jgi:hypothetical protein
MIRFPADSRRIPGGWKPGGNPAVGNPAVGNPAVGNPAVGNSAVGNPAVGNPAVGNPAVGNPAVGNRGYTDKTRLRGLKSRSRVCQKSRSHREETAKKRWLKPRLHETLPGWCAG